MSGKAAADYRQTMRNIGISAHIDSGKTTLTERILYYTGRINAIHEVRGKDGVGAKMDSMELEREKGITIQSAATFCRWKDHEVNIIDTPGHVDFTIEVERALRVLDGAVLVLCAVGGVQSQTNTVDRQMKRYGVPRLGFINKMDRQGSNPWRIVDQLREKLALNAAAVQVPIGIEDSLEGMCDLVTMKAARFEGDMGVDVVWSDIPENMKELCEQKRLELVEKVADVDDAIAEKFLMEESPSAEELGEAIRRSALALKFVPVFMGSAYKNKGVQLLLDGVVSYLPNPTEVKNYALDLNKEETEVEVSYKAQDPLIGLAFKLQESPFGQLTYLRIYQGIVRKGDTVTHIPTGRKVRIPRIVRMHSNDAEEVAEAKAGEIVALFGIDCSSGDTFTDGTIRYSMTSMHVPEPVISLSLTPTNKANTDKFSKALQRFMKEDPTFRTGFDNETKQTIISGMGELHLQIYVERIKREYGVECISGPPKVNYRESIQQKAEFDYLHKKQSGGAGQFGRVIGYIEPTDSVMEPLDFESHMVGNVITPSWFAAIEKGFKEQGETGPLTGHPMTGCRFIVTDGASHAVDSSELAFKIAGKGALRQALEKANPMILQPVMSVELTAPEEFQGVCVTLINKRKGVIENSDVVNQYVVINAAVPLGEMFGFSTDLRSGTQGKGEFTMEYREHLPAPRDIQDRLVAEYQAERAKQQKENN